MKKTIQCSVSAFTLIEAMAFLFIFSLIALTFYSLFGLGTRYLIEAKNRTEAVALASEKMETVRNLTYVDIGVKGGIPEGVINESEEVTRSGQKFLVHTFVQYVDDPFDGVAPADPLPNDYKRVKISVSWNSGSGERETSLVSRFVPPGLETSAGGGVLSINIVDSQGLGVSQAELKIINNLISPSVNFSTKSDNTGNLTLPSAKPSILGYQITATKEGYETVTTVDPTELGYVPTDSNVSVVEGAVNTKTIVIDKLSDIQVISQKINGEAIGNVSFQLSGGRSIGVDSSGNRIYSFSQDTQTGDDGKKEFLDISPGVFNYAQENSPSGYTFVRTLPNLPNIPVQPGEAKKIYSQFVFDGDNGLKLTLLKSGEETPIVGALVTLSNGNGWEEKDVTDDQGITLFPNENSQEFIAGTYQIKIQADGFEDYSEEMKINEFSQKSINLNSK